MALPYYSRREFFAVVCERWRSVVVGAVTGGREETAAAPRPSPEVWVVPCLLCVTVSMVCGFFVIAGSGKETTIQNLQQLSMFRGSKVVEISQLHRSP